VAFELTVGQLSNAFSEATERKCGVVYTTFQPAIDGEGNRERGRQNRTLAGTVTKTYPTPGL
jgi:hypothetical protein